MGYLGGNQSVSEKKCNVWYWLSLVLINHNSSKKKKKDKHFYAIAYRAGSVSPPTSSNWEGERVLSAQKGDICSLLQPVVGTAWYLLWRNVYSFKKSSVRDEKVIRNLCQPHPNSCPADLTKTLLQARVTFVGLQTACFNNNLKLGLFSIQNTCIFSFPLKSNGNKNCLRISCILRNFLSYFRTKKFNSRPYELRVTEKNQRFWYNKKLFIILYFLWS